MGRRPVVIEWQGQRRERRDVISELWSAGIPVAQIARQLDIPYQTAYMVVHPPGRKTAGPVEEGHAAEADGPPTDPPDAVLIGCVSQKSTVAAPAKDLYRSELFRPRRRHAETSGRP